MAIRQALVTYDADRFLRASSAEDNALNWIFQRALSGHDYPRERGILSIRHIPEGNEIFVLPSDDQDILMSFNPCITMPLDLVEKLVQIADRGCGTAGADKDLVRQVREEIAGTRRRFDAVDIVAVPRVSRETLAEREVVVQSDAG